MLPLGSVSILAINLAVWWRRTRPWRASRSVKYRVEIYLRRAFAALGWIILGIAVVLFVRAGMEL